MSSSCSLPQSSKYWSDLHHNLMIILPVLKHWLQKQKKNEHTTLLSQSYKGSCILCKMLNQQFICCSRLQPLKTKYPSLEIRPQTSSHITQAQRQFPLRHCTTLNKILYAKRVMGKNEEKQHKAQAELLEQVCITSVYSHFCINSIAICLPSPDASNVNY